jgi:hypothetical protein
MAEPLPDAYLLECELRARRFSGAFTGTSGTLAADVLRLLRELSRVKGEAAVKRLAARPPNPAAHRTEQARDPSCGGPGTSDA